MPTLSGQRPDARAAGQVVTFRSELPLRSRRFAFGMILDAMRTSRLLDRLLADPDGGLLWYELRAQPLANRYTTVSAWVSEEHLRRFAADPVHVAVMRRRRDQLGPSVLSTTTADAADLPIT